jgi:hypothetical protein
MNSSALKYMEVFVLLTSLLLVANMAMANTTPTADDRSQCERSYRNLVLSTAEKTRLVDICAQERAISRQVSTLESGIRTEENKREDCYRVRRSWRNLGLGRGATQAEIDACLAANAAATAEANRLRGELTALNTQLETARAQHRAATEGASSASSTRDQDAVRDAFNQLKMSIYDETLRASDAQTKLSNMARAIDNSVLSLYMRDRMAGLLNSPKMCQVVAACPNASTVTGRDLNSVFNGSMSTSANDAIEGSAPPTTPTQPADPAALTPVGN